MLATSFRESEERREHVPSEVCQSQWQYQELVGSLGGIIWRADVATLEYSYVSEQAETILGYPLDRWLRQPYFREAHLHPEDRLKVLSAYKQAAQDRERHSLEYRMIDVDGREVWFHDCVHSVLESGHGTELVGVMVDITDRKNAEKALMEMTGRLIRAQEEERSRIARELHDDFNQRLALLSIGLQRIAHTLGPQSADTAQVTDLCRLTQEIASDVHRLSHQLHPAKLQHLGLVPAIKGLCRELSDQYGAQIHFVHRNVPAQIAKESALCLFRVAQEALSNTLKHSGVKEGRLELFGDRGALHLCISDSGVGFDPQSASAKGSLGLVSMQERVRAAGGSITVESRPSSGTRISVHLAA
ncbi:MAG TPA: PAS domain-containing protein [Nitrospira sp.]|nr:PAS domain-containing protein [Nitrospira sp.]